MAFTAAGQAVLLAVQTMTIADGTRLRVAGLGDRGQNRLDPAVFPPEVDPRPVSANPESPATGGRG